MGFLENRRRKAYARSMNWDMMAAVMLMGYELGEAEDEGITDEDEKGDRALKVRDTVLAEIGVERFTQALIDADYDLEADDKDAVLERAIETSGYRAARSRLFPS